MEYVLSQICVGIASILLGLSFVTKNKKRVLLLCVLSSILFSLEYLLLGALTGMAMNIVSIIRCIWFFINHEKNGLCSLIVLNVLFVLGTVFTWKGIISLLPLAASMLFTYALWQHNLKIYTILEFPVSACWLTYNFIVGSVYGCVFEFILLLFVVFGLIHKKRRKENAKNG